MRRILVVVALLSAVLPSDGARAIPPAAAGALASDNVEFVANIPDVLAIGAKIIGDTMYVTTLQGLRIYDISLGVPVLIGGLELPHWQNEWVDTNGETLLIAADNVVGTGSVVWVIDVRIPQAPLIRGVVPVDNAHTATCVLDCRYAWTRGGDVIDLETLTYLGDGAGVAHHVDIDEAGLAWMDGQRVAATAGYDPAVRLRPTTIASGGRYGWHGSLRPDPMPLDDPRFGDGTIDRGEVVLGTDEEWMAASNGFCEDDGPFKTSWFHRAGGTIRIDLLDTFTIGQGTLPNAKPIGYFACSSHWFDEHQNVVANGWYEQGVRFLDVSDPWNIRQVGYYMPAVTQAWGARFHHAPDAPIPGLYVYTFDVARGIDVLIFEDEAGAPTQLAPRYNPVSGDVRPSEEFGWACRVLEGVTG